MKKILTTVIVLLMVMYVLVAQGATEAPEVGEPILSITDSRNRTIQFTEYPVRIVSLSPNITETIYALGAQHKLVGRTDYCDYPEEASSVPPMGDLLTPNVERIVATEADLVIISNLGQLQTIEAIEQAGIPVAFLDEQETMEGTFNIIHKVGMLTGKKQEAETLIADMKNRLQQISSTSESTRPTVYYAAGFGEWGDFTATGDTFIHDIITLAGGDNIASDAVNWSFQLELLHASDPDIIILPALWGSTYQETYDQFVKHPSYASLSAVQRDAIVTVDSNMIERQGPRSVLAIEILAQQFAKIQDRWQ